ncbi:MAG: polyprenyl synthetase family protein [Ilumatobacteraceae bacterium]|nr:polyprenyl synthetase family protein [Ilumatobacteraceae bacterium]MBJ7426076.1 polyprenyl synthetase family protein [Ilumatobacteraceae bacterium]MBJ7509272.1 polyprenyl synthetase family protein [Ilumatobacteraceae bacterium]
MGTSPLFDLESSDADRLRLDEALMASVKTPDAYLTEIASHLLLAGGKRLRPMFSVVASQVAGGPTTEEAIQGGISCELVHLGSLYHDDVMDESPTRRGVETVNAKWGNLQAILAGDFLLARASEIAASLGTEVAALLARTIGRLCEGQIEELRHTYNVARPLESYLSSISGKTASLYSTAARIGGLVSKFDRGLVNALTAYGEAFGMVFQIVDDVLDLSATDAQLGKPSGHDMVEGVYTLPVLYTLANGGVPASELADVLGKPLNVAERDKALSIVRSNGGIEAAIELAEMYVEAAEEACQDLPNTAATVALRFAPNALLASVR